MEGGSGFSDLNKTVRKKRSNRPRTNSQSGLDNRENSPHSSLPRSDNGSKASSDENTVHFTNSTRKELNLNPFNSRVISYTNAGEAEIFVKNGDEDGEFEEFGEGINENKDSINNSKANENKLKRVKLKLGGVTRTLHANFGESSQSDATRQKQKLILQEDSDSDSPSQHKGSNLRGIPWKDFSNKKVTEPDRKSKRVPKRRLLDDDDDHDDDVEIRFLEKLKNPKLASADDDDDDDDDDESSTKKHRRISRVMNMSKDGGDAGVYSSSSAKESKKSRSARVSDDNDYAEFADVAVVDSKIEMAVTTRQRAHLQTSASLVEFPNGLPPAPPRKQKEKVSDVEQQLKKAEAAQRRKMQVEKAARESEAEAIRKILGQDSSRKKREDKIKKRQEELAQERTANVKTLASNTVRWNMGPTGTTVTFPDDTGLPSILEPKPCCYPPPREKCAGPFCTNPYKYRDSKSRLPLCSLQCYKAIHEKMQPLSAC